MGILDKALGAAGAGARLAIGGAGAGARLAAGAVQRVRGGANGTAPSAAKDLGDADLANKVRSEIFRGLRGVDKGAIDVNVVDGAVYLRGIAKTPRQVNTLEERARAIPEVTAVHNLLHLPNTPAPTRTDTPEPQRKTRRGASTPGRPRTEPRRVNADKTVAEGEPVPRKRAQTRSGRDAAPLGGTGEKPRGGR